MAETEEIPEGMKRCSQCGEVKPATAAYFDKKKSVQSGLTAQCKSCISEKNKKYNEANKEKIAEAGKKYYEANREKIAEKRKKWYEAAAARVRGWLRPRKSPRG